MKVLDWIWFSGRHCIGIVLIEIFGEHKAYIGVGAGRDEKADIEFISNYGTTFPLRYAYAFFPKWKPKRGEPRLPIP